MWVIQFLCGLSTVQLIYNLDVINLNFIKIILGIEVEQYGHLVSIEETRCKLAFLHLWYKSLLFLDTYQLSKTYHLVNLNASKIII